MQAKSYKYQWGNSCKSLLSNCSKNSTTTTTQQQLPATTAAARPTTTTLIKSNIINSNIKAEELSRLDIQKKKTNHWGKHLNISVQQQQQQQQQQRQ